MLKFATTIVQSTTCRYEVLRSCAQFRTSYIGPVAAIYEKNRKDKKSDIQFARQARRKLRSMHPLARLKTMSLLGILI